MSGQSSSIMMHVFVIGSAGVNGQNGSSGQLPTLESIRKFMTIHPDKVCYFYFIDPRHLDVEGDLKLMGEYRKGDIPYSFVPRLFSWDTFSKEYRVEKGDHTLFIDYANYAASEYEYASRLGRNPNWHYWCPGCAGARLDPVEAYSKAIAIPHYSILGTDPLPAHSSVYYREGVMSEINSMLKYARLLPSNSSDPRPPPWLIREVGGDNETWAMMKESSHEVLANFFLANNKDYISRPIDTWYSLVRAMIIL